MDLHAHTVVSDGTLTPTQIVELAAKKGLAALAITDHDHLGGIAEARRAGERLGVEIVTGVELSVAHEAGDVHLLGYFLDPQEPRLAARLAGFRDVRARRGRLIVEKLQALGVAITIDDVAAAAGPRAGSIGRPHIARALVDKRIATSVKDAFDRWLADDRPAFVPKAKIDAQEAIQLVHGAGGVAILAHPGLLADTWRLKIVRELSTQGLDGVEIEHPRHDSAQRHALREIATKLGLLTTGGSDFHGENKPNVDLGYGIGGNVHVTTDTLEALRGRAAARQGKGQG